MFAPFSLEFYLSYSVNIGISGLSSTNCNFQGLSIQALEFYFKIQGLSSETLIKWDLAKCVHYNKVSLHQDNFSYISFLLG